MKRFVKVFLGAVGGIILLFIIDLVCIFTIHRPIFAIKKDNGSVYKGIFYDTYNCEEYSLPQIKIKGTKFTCMEKTTGVLKVKEIVDTTKDIKGFSCDEAIEDFYEDQKYVYSWECIKNRYMLVRYENGYEETIANALKSKTITISDLDKANINYIKLDKENNAFEIVFEQKPGNVKKQIVDKNTNKQYDYSVYVWNGDVKIVIDNKTYLLEEALNENKITMDEIIAKASHDIKNPLIANDGGSIEYHYDNYTIIKLHTLGGNRNVYIGNEKLSIDDVK